MHIAYSIFHIPFLDRIHFNFKHVQMYIIKDYAILFFSSKMYKEYFKENLEVLLYELDIIQLSPVLYFIQIIIFK